jgi:predicted dehydrogenase
LRLEVCVVRVGVVGYGYWGPNLVRNFHELPGCRVTRVADSRADRAALAVSRYPTIAATTSAAELIEAKDVDAVVVATPVVTHVDLALAALRAGKHVLVEKPLAHDTVSCGRMIEEAERHRRVLMVDHTFPYTGAVRKIKDLVDEGRLGDWYYYDSVRVNLGLFQHDVSVVWDLAVHDLAILDFLFAAQPVAVSATGVSHVATGLENLAYLTLFYSGNVIAHIHVNWLAPVKIRQTLIGGSKTMIVYDDIEPTEKVKVYDKGITLETDPNSVYDLRVGYRTGDVWVPKIEGREALSLLAQHFVACVERKERPITDAASGARVVAVMEAATRSIGQRGAVMELKAEAGTK